MHINKLAHSFYLYHSCALNMIAHFTCLVHYTFLGTFSSLRIHSYDCCPLFNNHKFQSSGSPVQCPYLSITGQLSIRKPLYFEFDVRAVFFVLDCSLLCHCQTCLFTVRNKQTNACAHKYTVSKAFRNRCQKVTLKRTNPSLLLTLPNNTIPPLHTCT